MKSIDNLKKKYKKIKKISKKRESLFKREKERSFLLVNHPLRVKYKFCFDFLIFALFWFPFLIFIKF